MKNIKKYNDFIKESLGRLNDPDIFKYLIFTPIEKCIKN